MSELNRVTVAGAGVLGGQIAWHSAFKGKTVVVYDISSEGLDKCRAAHEQYAAVYPKDVGATDSDIAATRERLTYTTDLASAVGEADLVIEAIPEIPKIKTEFYEGMASLLPEHTLLATNSSTLLARDFAAATGRPGKFAAMHFANLIWITNVVEIMAHPSTSEPTLTDFTEFAIEIGMLPIPVKKEQNGYVLNSWLVPLANAAQTLVTNGVSTPEDVDRTYLKVNPGATMGIFGFLDVIGMKTAFDVLDHWGHENADKQMLANAEYIKTNFLDKGLMGTQTGQGYYSYPNPAFQDPKFLEVPDISSVPDIVARAKLT